MKEFIATVEISHESFGGYTHKDGQETYIVRAKNKTSAVSKVKRHIRKMGGGYCRRVICILEKRSDPIILWNL